MVERGGWRFGIWEGGERGVVGWVLRGRGLADHPSGSCGIGLRVEQETLIEMCPPTLLWLLMGN